MFNDNKSGNYIFSMRDPRLSDEDRKVLFEIGTILYGSPDWNLEDLQPESITETNNHIKKLSDEYSELESRLEKTNEGKRRANVILATMRDDTATIYGRELIIKNNPIDIYTISSILNEALRMAASDRASLGGEARRNNDPKQIEKAMVYECWRMWQKPPSYYTNNSSFAQKMLNKFQPDDPSEETLHLQSTKVISDWCAAWKGGALFGAEKAFLLAKAKQK